MVDVQMGAEHVVDVIKPEAGARQPVQPGLLGEIHRRRVAFVLTRACVNQDNKMLAADHEGLVGNDHLTGCDIEGFRFDIPQEAGGAESAVSRKHGFRRAPRAVPLNNAGDCHIPDGQLPHMILRLPTAQ